MINRNELLVTDLCAEIDWLRNEAVQAKQDAAHWRDKFNTLVKSDLKQGEKVIGGLLALALTKTN